MISIAQLLLFVCLLPLALVAGVVLLYITLITAAGVAACIRKVLQG